MLNIIIRRKENNRSLSKGPAQKFDICLLKYQRISLHQSISSVQVKTKPLQRKRPPVRVTPNGLERRSS